MYILIFVTKSDVKNISNDCAQSFLAHSANGVKCSAGVQRWKFIADIFRKPILDFCSERPAQQGFTTFSHLWLQLPAWDCLLICVKNRQSTATHVANAKVQCIDYEPKAGLICLEQRDAFGSVLGRCVPGISGYSQPRSCNTETRSEDEPLACIWLFCCPWGRNSVFTSRTGRLTASHMWKYKMDAQNSASIWAREWLFRHSQQSLLSLSFKWLTLV